MNKRAQTSLEYAFLITAIIAAVAVMATYGKRAVAGFLQRSANQVSEKHFAPEKDNWEMSITGSSERETKTYFVKQEDEGGETVGWQMYSEDTILHDTTSRSGTE